MQIVWPSAGKALKLFHGAKVDPSGDASDLAPLINPPSNACHKRSAEQLLDDSLTTPRFTNNRFVDDMQSTRRNNTTQQQQSNFSSGIQGFTSDDYLVSSGSLPSSQTGSNNMVSSSYEWPGGGMNTNNINMHLSTAVLPQLYSISGLVDENQPRIHSGFNQQQTTTTTTNLSSSRRYPSYYDYSNFSPLGSVYDIREPNTIQVSSQPAASQMYIPENYGIYSMPLFLFSFRNSL